MNNSRYPDKSIMYRFIYLCKYFLRGMYHTIKNLCKIGLVDYHNKMHAVNSAKDELGVVAIVKDESQYIEEWINYHRIIGVSKFYIYDNGSTDGLKSVLRPYIEEGIVIYTYFPGQAMQEKAYYDCIQKYQNQIQWLLTIDIDEFIQSVDGTDLRDWLNEMPKWISQIEIGWLIFGSNGLKKKPNGFVIENYTRHATDDFLADYKPIVRPERVIQVKFPHEYEVAGITVDEQKKVLLSYPLSSARGARPASKNLFRINHYYSKSIEEFEQKSRRGDASVPGRKPRGLKDFREHDQNEIFDDSMLQYVRQIKKMEKKY